VLDPHDSTTYGHCLDDEEYLAEIDLLARVIVAANEVNRRDLTESEIDAALGLAHYQLNSDRPSSVG
jgi:hypothetical protein